MQSIGEVLRELGISYKDMGGEAVARCPAHDDSHPSWSCNLRTGAHHCFSCGFAGSLAGLASYVLDLPYPEAVLWVNARAGAARVTAWREDQALREVNFSPAYMKLSEASLALFTDPPGKEIWARNTTLDDCQDFGILWSPDTEDWIFPIRDPYNNELWGWQRKSARERRYRNYPAGVRKSETLFGLGSFAHGSTAILVESPVDCAVLATCGIRGGLASYGVQVSNKQLSLVHRLASDLVLALDNDHDGIRETDRIMHEYNLLPVRAFDYGDCGEKDVGRMALSDIRKGIANAKSSIGRRREKFSRKGL